MASQKGYGAAYSTKRHNKLVITLRVDIERMLQKKKAMCTSIQERVAHRMLRSTYKCPGCRGMDVWVSHFCGRKDD